MDNKSFMLELSTKLRDVTNVKQSPSVQQPSTSDCRSSDVNVYEKLCYKNNNSDYSEITDVSLDTPRFVSKASKWRSAKTGALLGCFTCVWAVSWNIVCVCVHNKK